MPQFLVVGAQKAGTTTLQSLLDLHPKIFLPKPKEVQFFSLHYVEGLEWYRNHFSAAVSNQCIGEITPYYLFHPFSAERIKTSLGSVRIIILLRDPVSRTISHYRHSCRLGFEDLSFIDALRSEPKRLQAAEIILRLPNGRHQQHQECSYLGRSLYRHQVERYWDIFGKNQVLLLSSEDLFSDPWSSLLKIFNFLGLEPISKPDNSCIAVRANASEVSTKIDVSKSLLQYLRLHLDDSYQFIKDELGRGRN